MANGSVRVTQPKFYNVSFSTTTCAAAKSTQVASVSLRKGLWLLNASIQWKESFDSLTYLQFTNMPSGASSIVRASANSGGGICISQVFTTSTTVTIGLTVYNGNSSARQINQNRFTAVILSDQW